LAVLRPGGEPADVVWPGDGDPGTVHFAAQARKPTRAQSSA